MSLGLGEDEFLISLLPQRGEVLEIGCYDGDVTGQILAKTQCNVTSVDTFSGEGSNIQDHLKQHNINLLEEFKKKTAGFRNRLTICIGDSREVLPLLGAFRYDAIFIDGDHRYSTVSEDIKNSLKLLKPGGLLAGHDFDRTDWKEEYTEMDYVEGCHHGVTKAVLELVPNYKLFSRVWYIYKPIPMEIAR